MLYQKTERCRACGNTALTPILDLGEHALTGRFPAPDEADPPIAPLQLLICDVTRSPDACGLVQLGHTCDLSQMYGATYGYRSSITKTMVSHLHQTAADVLARAQPRPSDWILEVGSNDGTVQNYLAKRALNLVAIDPSAAKFAESYPKESRLIVDFFSASAVRSVSGNARFKAIISIAMFYDLEHPLEFMRSVRDLLEVDGVWCCEQAYLPAIFTSLCYDTICHEHLSYYCLTQFDYLARRAGLRIVDVTMNNINGGSFCVFACRDDSSLAANDDVIKSVLASEARLKLHSPETWSVFARRVRQHRARVRSFFEEVRAGGDQVYGLGASTKGNVVLQYAGITPDLMPAISDRDPKKVGLRTPRTNIPIVSEDEVRSKNPKYLFVGPWHFREEIIAREKDFLVAGGRIVFPLPRFEVVRAQSSASPSSPAPRPTLIHWAKPTLFDDERVLVTEALDSTMISGGHFVDEFEQRFAELHGKTSPAITTSNGTTALQLAYLALGIGPGDEVIVPGWGFMAAANMAIAIGATPVFADIDAKHWVLDPEDVAAKITPKTKAIVAIHTYGNLCDLARLTAIARENGVFLIEDCAESLGSKFNSQMCGTFGDIGTFSFQATKTVTCGEGGALICRSDDVAARAKLIRNHGMQGLKRYWHYAVGHNFRLTNLQCAMLCAQLNHWQEILTSRERLLNAYKSRLDAKHGLLFQTIHPAVSPTMWAVGLQLPGISIADRDKLLELMLTAGIECRPGFYPPSSQDIYNAPQLPRADRIAEQVIVPPIDPNLTEQSFDLVCQTFLRSLQEIGYSN